MVLALYFVTFFLFNLKISTVTYIVFNLYHGGVVAIGWWHCPYQQQTVALAGAR